MKHCEKLTFGTAHVHTADLVIRPIIDAVGPITLRPGAGPFWRIGAIDYFAADFRGGRSDDPCPVCTTCCSPTG